MKPTLPISLLSLAAIFPNAHAETVPQVSAIVVTATGLPQLESNALAPTRVITAQELKRHAYHDLAEVLRFVGGLEIGRNGGSGKVSSVFMRGTNSNHVLVLIDGIKVNDTALGLAKWQHLPSQAIERIEIVKGPRSALYGSEALGGVVHVITKKSPNQSPTLLAAEIGEHQTERLTLSHAAQLNQALSGHLSLSRQRDEGTPTRIEQPKDRGNEDLNGQVSLRHATETTRTEFTYMRSTGNTEYTGSSFSIPSFALLDEDYLIELYGLQTHVSLANDSTVHLAINHFSDELEQNQPSTFVQYIESQRDVVDLRLDQPVGTDHLVTIGAYGANQQGFTRSVAGNSLIKDEIWALYTQDQYVHHQHAAVVALRFSDHDSFGQQFTGHFEYGYEPNPRQRFTAGVGKGFRSPGTSDLAQAPNLDAEQSVSIDFGLEWTLTNNHSTGVNFFHTRIEDLIDFDKNTFIYSNVEKAQIEGVELAWVFSARHWATRMELTLQDPKNLVTGEKLARRADTVLNVQVSLDPDPCSEINLNWVASSKRNDSGFTTDVNAGYGLLNLSLSRQIAPAWRVGMSIENLLDQDYALATNFTSLERTAYVRIHFTPGAKPI